MKLNFVLLFLIFTNSIFSQSLNDLDNENGFQHFKLGSSPLKIKDIVITKTQSKNKKLKMYDYIGKDISSIAGVEVNHISLIFIENKLALIDVLFGGDNMGKEFTFDDYSKMLQYTELAYGNNWEKALNNDGTIVDGNIWTGNKVKLELYRKDLSKSYTNPLETVFNIGKLTVTDIKLTSEK